MQKLFILIYIFSVLACTHHAFATEPCEHSICLTSEKKFLEKDCFEASTWVAVGLISDVVHHEVGKPLNRDFADFTFTVLQNEKGSPSASVMKFHVDWCENPPLPKDTSGTFRIYGTKEPYPGGKGSLFYLAIEKVVN